jgi:8-amino-7-oxononanoate synthase
MGHWAGFDVTASRRPPCPSVNDFDRELNERLAALREQGLYRELRRVDSPQTPRIEVEGTPLLNFSSNDYLGLANDPVLKEAAVRAVEHHGAGAGASRLISGSLAPHHELEEALAEFKGAQAALSFSSGYAAAVGTICALLGKDDVVVMDKLVHACVVDAARLCGAKLRVFAHNDLNELADILAWTSARTRENHAAARAPRTLVVTESVFSMDGDHAPLREMVELKDRHGAWLMVDEAHATGLYGKHRRGMAEECGVSERIEIQMGTLGKALGSAGGFICGSRALIDFLVNRARTFIFSTAPVPASAAAATAAIRLVQSGEGAKRCDALWQRVSQFTTQLASRITQPSSLPSAILPILIGHETAAVKMAAALRDRGIYVPAIRYPTVARGRARLRVTLTAAHTAAEVTALTGALALTHRASPISHHAY